MVGLCYLKHSFDVGDERLLELWVENPYWQHFCGFEFFQHKLPCDPTSLVRYRKRIGPDGMESLLAETVRVGPDAGAVRPSSLERICIDTTIQPKAIAHPLDSRLYHKALEVLVRQAKRAGIRLAKQARLKVQRYGHAKFDHRMDRNHLLGAVGDAINALAAACAYNLRRILDAIRRLYALIILVLITGTAKIDTWTAPTSDLRSTA